MTTTVDSQHRAVLKKFAPGDILDVQDQGPDVVVLRRMKPPRQSKARLVRRKGELIAVGGPKLTGDEVKAIIDDWP